MKKLILFLCIGIVIILSCTGLSKSTEIIKSVEIPKKINEEVLEDCSCLEQDVWVYFRHKDIWSSACMVVVYIPKNSLVRDSKNCPGQDTKVIGVGYVGKDKFFGMHVVTIKKGLLNTNKYVHTKPPRKIKHTPNNRNSWCASYTKD